MSNDYDKFAEYMKKQDSILPSDKPSVSVGMKDEKGSLLILGGYKANLWRLSSGLYAVGGVRTSLPEQAMELYNQYNGTSLPLDYVWKVFEPWYEKQFVIVARVPSRTDPNRSYTVRKSPSGELSCECYGYMFRRACWHTEAVKELTNA